MAPSLRERPVRWRDPRRTRPSLDARAEHELFERGRQLFADRAVLLISHRFSTARWADRIYVLHDGAVVETGDHRSLVAAGGHYAQRFELQAAAYRPPGASDEPHFR